MFKNKVKELPKTIKMTPNEARFVKSIRNIQALQGVRVMSATEILRTIRDEDVVGEGE